MRLLSPSEFSIRLSQPYTSKNLATSEILFDDTPTGIILTGQVLEAALEWCDYTVAFLTDDIIHEDMLRIYMFNANHQVIDSAVLGAMYSTGVFRDLNLIEPNTLTFTFIGGITWRLILLPEAEFSLPFISDPRGVSRPLKFFRRFRLLGKPLPETSR
ncbi:hypothetical protein HSX11_14410 [Oxalobacteraceae bacterium]|nr:hypothetical protein [Oxalobacteraceae bacterium]